MEPQETQETTSTTSFVPVIARMDRLHRVLLLLDEKSNNSLSPMRDLWAMDSNKECVTLSSAIEEVQQKGTLLDRLTLLENRVLQLSQEMDERNTSKPSSSTAQVSEIAIPERRDDVKFNIQQMQDPLKTVTHEGASSADSSVRESTAEHKKKPKRQWIRSRESTAEHKKKPKRQWIRLLRLRC